MRYFSISIYQCFPSVFQGTLDPKGYEKAQTDPQTPVGHLSWPFIAPGVLETFSSSEMACSTECVQLCFIISASSHLVN